MIIISMLQIVENDGRSAMSLPLRNGSQKTQNFLSESRPLAPHGNDDNVVGSHVVGNELIVRQQAAGTLAQRALFDSGVDAADRRRVEQRVEMRREILLCNRRRQQRFVAASRRHAVREPELRVERRIAAQPDNAILVAHLCQVRVHGGEIRELVAVVGGEERARRNGHLKIKQ
jgi:hypothetical protein